MKIIKLIMGMCMMILLVTSVSALTFVYDTTQSEIGLTNYYTKEEANDTFLKEYIEDDPIFTSSDVYDVSDSNITEWNTAYSWGDHATEGYLTSYTETDPVYESEKDSYLSYTGLTGNVDANYYNISNLGNIYNKSIIDEKIDNVLDEENDPLSYHTDENINASGYNISADRITSYGNNVASYELTKEDNEVTIKWLR